MFETFKKKIDIFINLYLIIIIIYVATNFFLIVQKLKIP